MKKIYSLIIMAAVASLAALAYDFKADNSDGKTIYYNLLNDHEVEVTSHTRFRPTETYEGRLDIPESITVGTKTYTVAAIGEYALFNCRSLSYVNMPETITTIGSHAYAWCDALTEITLPKNVSLVGNNVFDGCYSLTCIKVTRGNRAYTSEGCVLYTARLNTLVAYTPASEGIVALPDGVVTIGAGSFGSCTFLTEVILPDGLQTIEDNAFYFCNFLNTIAVPESVTHIGHAAFSDCLSLDSITVADGNTAYSSREGVLFDKSRTRLIQSPGATVGMAKVPDGVKEVGQEAFFRNYSLTTVKLPATVETIEEAAFIDCPKLGSVEIPASVNRIGTLAFAMCPSLTSLYVDVSDPSDISLGDDLFSGLDTDRCTLYVPKGSEGLYANAPQWRDFTYITATDALSEQTITWQTAADTLYTGSQLRLNAVTTSKLPVRYTLSTKSQEYASLDGKTLTVTAPGTIYVTAYQPGNSQYKPAEPVTVKFEARLTGSVDIESDSQIRVYGSLGSIIIKGADDTDIAEVYDTNGMMIYAGTERSIGVNPGCIYIVRIAGQSFKVIVMQ